MDKLNKKLTEIKIMIGTKSIGVLKTGRNNKTNFAEQLLKITTLEGITDR